MQSDQYDMFNIADSNVMDITDFDILNIALICISF